MVQFGPILKVVKSTTKNGPNLQHTIDDLPLNIVKKVQRRSHEKFHCEVCYYSARVNYNLKRRIETKH